MNGNGHWKVREPAVVDDSRDQELKIILQYYMQVKHGKGSDRR